MKCVLFVYDNRRQNDSKMIFQYEENYRYQEDNIEERSVQKSLINPSFYISSTAFVINPLEMVHIVYNTNNKLYDDDKMEASHEYPEDQECLLVFNNSFDVSVFVSQYLPLKELLNNNTINPLVPDRTLKYVFSEKSFWYFFSHNSSISCPILKI